MTGTSWRGRVRIGVLALVAFVLSHDLIFLVTYGPAYRVGMARLGHDDRWTTAVFLVLGLAVALAIAGGVRLAQLARLARRIEAGTADRRLRPPARGARLLARDFGRSWLVIFPIALLLFVVGENIEHVSAGLPLPGLGVLGSLDYHGTVVILGAVSAAGALVDALYRWRAKVLEARIEAARSRWLRANAAPARPDLPWVERRHASIAGHTAIGRAPPAGAAA